MSGRLRGRSERYVKSVTLLVVLLVLALIFGIGAVVKGVIWLAIVGFIAFVALSAAAIGSARSHT